MVLQLNGWSEMKKTQNIGLSSRLFLTAASNLTLDAQLRSGQRDNVYQWILAKPNQEGVFENISPDSLIEFIWEIVRLREFPHLPSRMDCLFLWIDEGAARGWHHRTQIMNFMNTPEEYQKRHNDPNISSLYEVEVVECQRAFAGNMDFTSYLNHGETVATLMERARQYWRGEKITNTAEVLLEGSVAIRRNLLARKFEEIHATTDSKLTKKINASLEWVLPQEKSWSLSQAQKSIHNLEGVLQIDARLPMKVAGWIGLRLEGNREPMRCLPNCSPILLQPDRQIEIFTKFSNFPDISAGTRYQPVLICDRSAAHYWQLDSYWEGQIDGEWQIIPEWS